MKKFLAVLTAVFMVCIMTVPAFAYTFGPYETPAFTDEMMSLYENSGYNHLAFCSWGAVRGLVMFGGGFTYNPDKQELVAGKTSTFVTFILDPAQGWVENSDGIGNIGSPFLTNVKDVHWANFDVIRYGRGDVYLVGDTNFPPLILEEVIQEVTAETLETETVPALTKVVGVLMIVAVGCLASLMALRVFRTLFGRYFVSR